MKTSKLLLCGAISLAIGANTAHAQRERPNREDRQDQRQQQMEAMTPEQRAQMFQQRWEERYKNATPEQRQRMDEMRAQMNQRMQEAGIDPNAPDAMQQAMAKGVMGNMGGNGGGGGGRGGQMSPEQRDDARRALMVSTGITDKATQDAIIAFMNEREKARADLLKLARETAAALMATSEIPEDKPAPAPAANGAAKVVPTAAEEGIPEMKSQAQLDEGVAKAYTSYQKALTDDRAAYSSALKDLDGKINFSTTPRLKSFLALAGVLEFDPLSFGGVSAIFSSGQQGGGGGNGGGGNGGGGNWGNNQGGGGGNFGGGGNGGGGRGGRGGRGNRGGGGGEGAPEGAPPIPPDAQ